MKFGLNKIAVNFLLLCITQINTALFAGGGEIEENLNFTSRYQQRDIETVHPTYRHPSDPNKLSWKWDDDETQKALLHFLPISSENKKPEDKEAKSVLENLFKCNGNNAHILRIGPFLVNTTMKLGSGDEGSVFLALHVPSGYLVACKQTRRVEWNGEAENLSALKRLYGFYDDKASFNPLLSMSYLFMPLAIGQRVDYLAIDPNFERASLPAELLRLNALTEAYLKEVTYMEESKVFHGESTSAHFIATTIKDQTNVMAIDLSPKANKRELNEIKDENGKYSLSYPQVLVLRYIYEYFPNPQQRIREDRHPNLNTFKEEIQALSDKVRWSDDKIYVSTLKELYEKYKPLIEEEIKTLQPTILEDKK